MATLSSKVKTVFLLGLATTAAVLVSDVLINACVVMSLLSFCNPAPILRLFSVPASALNVEPQGGFGGGVGNPTNRRGSGARR